MKNKKIQAAAIAALLSLTILAGCSSADKSSIASSTSGSTASSSAAESGTSASTIAASTESVDVRFDSSDYYFDWKSNSYTTLDMTTGSQTITKSGTYEITGTLADGSLIVDVDQSADDGVVYLVLNNTSITSETSAPIYVKSAEKVVLMLENGTSNTVSQGSGVTVNADDEPSAAVFSKADLTITGGGTLNVMSDYNDGITSKDTLKITDGTLYVQAQNDGIVGKDLLAVEKGSVIITAGKDGLRATNDTDAGMGSIVIKDGMVDISAGSDAIQAYSVLQIDGGSFDLTSGGGYAGTIAANSDFSAGGTGKQFTQPNNPNSAAIDQTADMISSVTAATDLSDDSSSESDSKKCLKADGGIIISGGEFTVSSYEDALNSSGDIVINGGAFAIQAGDDAIHSDAGVFMSGGTVTVVHSNEGIEGKNITVNNGDISVTSSDDGFNVNDGSGVLTLSGGSVFINAGGDGLDSNGSVIMTGGTAYVDGPTNSGNGAIDYNTGFHISGGVLIATGSSGMAQTGDADSSQPAILMYYSEAQAAGTAVTVKDESGNVVASFTPAKQYASAAISAPGLKTGQTYTLCSGETEVVAFTLADTVTYLNESGITINQGMGPGGQMGGMPDAGGVHGGGPMGGGKPGSNG